jgi:hypothetical protein
MPDPFGIIDGTKQVTKTLNESVKASEELSKAIDGVLAVADKAAKERAALRKNSREVSPDTTTIIEAVDEFQRLMLAKQSEENIKEEITKKKLLRNTAVRLGKKYRALRLESNGKNAKINI